MANTATARALDELIEGILRYLTRSQETSGPFAGSFWSELAYHIPLLNYRAGGSHHNRTGGSAGLAFCRLADRCPDDDLLDRAAHAFNWIVTRQHEDGGLFEITNNDKPSQFHLEYERSSVSLGIVCHGLYAAFAAGLPETAEYTTFLRKAAEWQLAMETDPGNFLHSEGYPPEKLILNASAHAAETLLVGAEVAESDTLAEDCRDGAVRAIEGVLGCQRSNGMLPYSNFENDNSISYTATVCWVLQNLIDAGLLPDDLVEPVECALERATGFLAGCIQPDGRIQWEEWENHGQKYHTWVYGIVAKALAWSGYQQYEQEIHGMIAFLHRELYDDSVRLCRLYDFPVGETRTICGCKVLSENFHECAYHQADLLDCLVNVESELSCVCW